MSLQKARREVIGRWPGHKCLMDLSLDLPPEVFMGQMQIHILGIGPGIWPTNEMGPSRWCLPLSTSDSRPNSNDSRRFDSEALRVYTLFGIVQDRYYRDSILRAFHPLDDLFCPQLHTRKGSKGGIRTIFVRNWAK
ncbi:hypothetical protein B9Z19DRAFT_1127912 [Tuber borchii]|uniref:Uncharacterized protein n=1 Tax=Tuber borchii TaxID=42251 RepID=A0A2T6ZQI2_TUBBO|nr:hypothetical protein B9Z19DRAFT_1127912 [Tuber borchii]